jgi:hypothetical protein
MEAPGVGEEDHATEAAKVSVAGEGRFERPFHILDVLKKNYLVSF